MIDMRAQLKDCTGKLGFLVLATLVVSFFLSCALGNSITGNHIPMLCIYPDPNPNLSGMAAFEDSYAKAAELNAKVVTFYYKLSDLDDNLNNDECIIKYLAPLAETYNLDLAIEIEGPEPPGVLDDLPADILGLNFNSSVLRDRYASLVSKFLDAVITYDTTQRLKYLFFGNEVDSYFNEHPDELDNWDLLLSQLVDLTRTKCPYVSSGTVVTYHDALQNGRLDWVKNHFGPRSDIIAVTFYPEWMPNGYQQGKLDQQIGDIISAYGGTWKLALIESGISADNLKGGSETQQVTYAREIIDAIINRSKDFEFTSVMFAVFPVNWGTPPFSDWVAGVSVYRSDGTARPVRDIIIGSK